MGGAINPNAIPLPSGWSVFAKGYLLRAVGLARYALKHVRSWCADSPIARVRLKGRVELLEAEVALLKEELRIKDARLAAIPARQRPHCLPQDRLAILVLKTARGWSFEVAARRFLVTAVTLATWTKRADEQDSTLVQTPRPINLFPPFVAEVIRSLKAVAPTMGARRIADLLSRAALHVGPTTVRRALRLPGKVSPPPAPPSKKKSTSGRTIVAKRPNHVWNVDLTTIDTSGTSTPWPPYCAPPSKPFTWWIAVIVDHFSRRAIGFALFPKQPSAKAMTRVLDRAIARVGAAPKYTVTDQGVQFRDVFKRWCRRRGIAPRFGAVGKHGSIAVTERFILSLKSELLRKILVPFDSADLRRSIARYFDWYNEYRPHRSLGGATPLEVYLGARPANERQRIEPRSRYPANGACAKPQSTARAGTRPRNLELVAGGLHGAPASLLPIVAFRDAA